MLSLDTHKRPSHCWPQAIKLERIQLTYPSILFFTRSGKGALESLFVCLDSSKTGFPGVLTPTAYFPLYCLSLYYIVLDEKCLNCKVSKQNTLTLFSPYMMSIHPMIRGTAKAIRKTLRPSLWDRVPAGTAPTRHPRVTMLPTQEACSSVIGLSTGTPMLPCRNGMAGEDHPATVPVAMDTRLAENQQTNW